MQRIINHQSSCPCPSTSDTRTTARTTASKYDPSRLHSHSFSAFLLSSLLSFTHLVSRSRTMPLINHCPTCRPPVQDDCERIEDCSAFTAIPSTALSPTFLPPTCAATRVVSKLRAFHSEGIIACTTSPHPRHSELQILERIIAPSRPCVEVSEFSVRGHMPRDSITLLVSPFAVTLLHYVL